MSTRPLGVLLQRFLFNVTVGVAFVVGVLVLLSPWLDAGQPQPQGWPRLVAVFARDATTRRTAVAISLGLVVTACVFFRPPDPTPAPSTPRHKPLPPGNVGA